MSLEMLYRRITKRSSEKSGLLFVINHSSIASNPEFLSLYMLELHRTDRMRGEDAAKGRGKLLTIYLEGERKNHYWAEYRAAELSDEQFARLQGSASSWVEQEGRVTEWKMHGDKENLSEQKLFPVARVGYTGVKWGGSEVTRDVG